MHHWRERKTGKMLFESSKNNSYEGYSVGPFSGDASVIQKPINGSVFRRRVGPSLADGNSLCLCRRFHDKPFSSICLHGASTTNGNASIHRNRVSHKVTQT